ncbi:MAG: hypothetical protein RR994_00490, partial [Clostridia bacterium]
GSETLAVGENTTLKTGVMLNSGREMQFGPLLTGEDADNNIKIVNKTPNIVSVVGNKITALALGTATIEVVAKVAGVEYTKTATINVSDEKIATVEASLDKNKAFVGQRVTVSMLAKTSTGRVISNDIVAYGIKSSNTGVATVNANTITAVGPGTTDITVTGMFAGAVASTVVSLTVEKAGFAAVQIIAPRTSMKADDTGIQLSVKCVDGGGTLVPKQDTATVVYTSLTPGTIQVSKTGLVVPIALGTGKIKAEATLDGITQSAIIEITVSQDKTCRTVYSEEMVAAAQENVLKYDWAASQKKLAVTKAERFIGKEDMMWDVITTQDLPRGIVVGYRFDPDAYSCKDCGTDLREAYGYYPWIIDVFNKPYKVQCPKCRRIFPSNDFASYYKLGMGPNGQWDYELAKQKNAELVAQGKDGYLKNIENPEWDITHGAKNWGVDDGYGYKTGIMKKYTNGATKEEVHTYIGYYNHWGVWHENGTSVGIVTDVLRNVKNAYLYTGDPRYGRLGAIMVDRIADVYPDMFTGPTFPNFSQSDSSKPYGKIIGCIWEIALASAFAQSYDAFYPMYDDPYVVNYLHSKAEQFPAMTNQKNTPAEIRSNCENGLLREVFKATKDGHIDGNFGMTQGSVVNAAISLDSPTETREMLDWTFRSNEGSAINKVTGGDIYPHIMDMVSRDGIGDESSPGYNGIWVTHPMTMSVALNRYGKYPEYNLFKDPKYIKMFYTMARLTTAGKATVAIGDTGYCAEANLDFIGDDQAATAFANTGDSRIGQIAYMIYKQKNRLGTAHLDIFAKDPEKVNDDIQACVDKYGEWDTQRSDMLPAYGFRILRNGVFYPSDNPADHFDTQGDYWMSDTTS